MKRAKSKAGAVWHAYCAEIAQFETWLFDQKALSLSRKLAIREATRPYLIERPYRGEASP